MRISNAYAEKNGEYAVVYEAVSNNVKSYAFSNSTPPGIQVFEIKVVGDPIVTIEPALARVTEGSDVTFTCQVQSSADSLTYKWSKNDDLISGAGASTLVISNALHENAAMYSCEASFSYAATGQQQKDYSGSATAYLVINDDTTLEVLTPFLLASVGAQTATLSFDISSRVNDQVSADMVTWYKDSVPLEAGGGISFASSNKNLIISNPDATHEVVSCLARLFTNICKEGLEHNKVLTEADAGYVKVVVETSAGRSEKSAEILVIKQDDISPTKSTENQLMGKQLTISVSFNMMPLPVQQNVQWARSSDILTDTMPRVEFYDSGQRLVIKDTDLSDSGTYRVSVNKVSADGSVAASTLPILVGVSVRISVTISNPSPSFSLSLSLSLLSLSLSLTLSLPLSPSLTLSLRSTPPLLLTRPTTFVLVTTVTQLLPRSLKSLSRI
eukprot:sb/3464724/